jgi:hypothetical protein
MIDSGIQENHPLLANAIDHNYSRSWVPSEIDLTADLVSNGGHGTRVAGAILYPRKLYPETEAIRGYVGCKMQGYSIGIIVCLRDCIHLNC